MSNIAKQFNRNKRHTRIRAKILGTVKRPRVSVFKSNRYTLVQLIDDVTGKTLISEKTISATKTKPKGSKIEKAFAVGEILAEKAKTAGIKEAIFDKGGFKYHGRVKAVADGLRKGGIRI